LTRPQASRSSGRVGRTGRPRRGIAPVVSMIDRPSPGESRLMATPTPPARSRAPIEVLDLRGRTGRIAAIAYRAAGRTLGVLRVGAGGGRRPGANRPAERPSVEDPRGRAERPDPGA